MAPALGGPEEGCLLNFKTSQQSSPLAPPAALLATVGGPAHGCLGPPGWTGIPCAHAHGPLFCPSSWTRGARRGWSAPLSRLWRYIRFLRYILRARTLICIYLLLTFPEYLPIALRFPSRLLGSFQSTGCSFKGSVVPSFPGRKMEALDPRPFLVSSLGGS